MTKQEMWEIFKSFGQAALSYTHYDLAALTELKDPSQWKDFLLDPEIADWIASEIKIMQNAEMNKLIQGIGDSSSVGKAQLMQALSKINSETTIKDGPIFIYTYIPLNSEQAQADNVRIAPTDIFIERSPS